jgi:hypothetical protein
MTTIEDHLNKLSAIVPDGEFAQRSRKQILGNVPTAARTPWRLFQESLRFGSAVALASVLLIVALGGFATWRSLSPFHISSLDPAGLRAEAQAIDIQVEVANIGYVEPSVAQSTAPRSASRTSEPAPAPKQAGVTAEPSSETSTSTPSSTPPAPLTIDQALERLAE